MASDAVWGSFLETFGWVGWAVDMRARAMAMRLPPSARKPTFLEAKRGLEAKACPRPRAKDRYTRTSIHTRHGAKRGGG